MKRTFVMLLTFLLLFTLTASAEDETISVAGSAVIYLEADQANLNLGFRIKSEDLGAAQSQSASKIDAIIKALEEDGIEAKDIATADYSIYSYTEYTAQGTEKQYYQVNHLLNVTVRDIAQIGHLIDLAVRAGANAVDSISFTSQKSDEAYQQAMTEAVADSRKKAEILCAAAGVRLGKVQSISFTGNQYTALSNSRNYKMAESAADGAASTVIQSGSVSVSASVTIVYELEN